MPLNYDNEELEISDELSNDPYSEESDESKVSKLYKKTPNLEKYRENLYFD